MKSKDLKTVYAGKTFAEAASIISNKYKHRDTDLTQKLSYEMEIAELAKMNESVKMQSEADTMIKDKLKCGGKVKMQSGNFLTDPPFGVPPGNTDWIAQQQLGLLNPLPTGDSNLATDNTPLTTNRAMIANPLPANSPVATDNTILTGNNQITLGKNIAPVIDSSGQFKGVDSPKPDYVGTKKPGIFQRLFGENSNIYNPGLAGLGVNMGLNAAILAAGYDKEKPQTNKYESDVRRLMEGRGIDSTAVQNRINASMRAGMENTQNVRSANVRNALLQNIGATAMEQTSGAELQAQQVRNQLTGEYANVLNNLGLQESQARMASRELTARNKGQFLTNLSKLGQTAAEGGKFFTTLKANDKLNELYTNVLNLKFEDFGVGTDLIKKIRNGEELSADDIVQIKNSKNSMFRMFGEYYERSVGASTNKPAGTTSKPAGTTPAPAGGNTSTTPTTGSTTQTGTPTTSTTTTPTGNTPTNSSTSTAPTTTQTGTTNTQKTNTTNNPVSQTGTKNQPASGASTPSVSTTTPTTSTPAPNVSNTPAQSTTAKPTTANKPVTQETPIQQGETLPNPADTQSKSTTTTKPVNSTTPANTTTTTNTGKDIGLNPNTTTPTSTSTAPAKTNTQQTSEAVIPNNRTEKLSEPINDSIFSNVMGNFDKNVKSNKDENIAASEKEVKNMFASDDAVIQIYNGDTVMEEMKVNGFIDAMVLQYTTPNNKVNIFKNIKSITTDDNGRITKLKLYEDNIPPATTSSNTSKKQSISLPENVSKEVDKVLDREVKFGSSTGTGLDNYGNQDLAKQLGRNPTKEEAKSWIAENVLPAVQPHFKTDTEIGKAADFTYNTGRDARVYMLDAYLKSKGSSFSSRSAYNVPWRQLEPSFEKSWDKYKKEIENLPESERVKLIDQGREFYYKNTFNDKDGKGTPGVDYWEKSRTNKYGKDSYYDNETGYYYKKGEDGSLSPAYGKSWSLRLK